MFTFSAIALLAAATRVPLTLATYAYPSYDRAAALSPLADALSTELNRPVALRLYPTPDALAAAVATNEIDFAVTNLAAYAQVGRLPGVRAVAILDVPAPTLDRYRGVLIAGGATGLSSLDDVRGRARELRYSEVLPGSTSGALTQAEALAAGGHGPPRFESRRFAGTHDAALEDVLAGRADVAALAEEPWRRLVAERPEDAARLRQIWRSAPLPPGPVICVQRKEIDCSQVAAFILRGRGAASGAATALAAGWSETQGATSFKPVDLRSYAGFLPPAAAEPAQR